MTTPLPTTKPSDEHAGGGTLFAGLAIPYVIGALVIAAGMVIGGTTGLAMALGTFLLLVVGVFVGIFAFIHTDSGH